MGEIQLPGLARARSIRPTLIKLLTDNLNLAQISVIKTSSPEVGGAYDPDTDTAIVELPQARFEALRAAVSDGGIVTFTLTYQTPGCEVTGFVFAPHVSELLVKGNGGASTQPRA